MSTDELNKVQNPATPAPTQGRRTALGSTLGSGLGSGLSAQPQQSGQGAGQGAGQGMGQGSSAPAASTTRRSTLGKGLGALLGEAAEDYAALDSVRPAKNNVAVDLLAPSPFQPRRVFAADALADLAQSVRERGVIQPLVVRRDPARAGHYQIIAGERRWRAAQQAGLTEVPVVVRDYTDAQAMEVAVIENVQRQDLNAIEEAMGYQRLCKEFGHTQEDVARLVGKSRPHVANMMRLLQLPKMAQDMLIDGRLNVGTARALLTTLQDPQQLAKFLAGEVPATAREAEQLAQVQRAEQGHAPTHPQQHPRAKKMKLRDANTVQLEQTLTQALGLKVNILGTGTRGTLMIKYQSLEQLDDVLKKLCGQVVRV